MRSDESRTKHREAAAEKLDVALILGGAALQALR
jgi:hypothetical protein